MKHKNETQQVQIENTDVSDGVANGTTAIFESVNLKGNKQPYKIKYNGYWVLAVKAEDVEYIRLRWTKDENYKRTFTIAPAERTYNTKITINEFGTMYKMDCQVKINQLPITLNHATTGHKLQGKTKESLMVGEWNNTKNWIYVVLSRVKRLRDLYLLTELPWEANMDTDSRVTRMLQNLRSKWLAKPQKTGELSLIRSHFRTLVPL